jgi:hypothetical protein
MNFTVVKANIKKEQQDVHVEGSEHEDICLYAGVME